MKLYAAGYMAEVDKKSSFFFFLTTKSLLKSASQTCLVQADILSGM